MTADAEVISGSVAASPDMDGTESVPRRRETGCLSRVLWQYMAQTWEDRAGQE